MNHNTGIHTLPSDAVDIRSDDGDNLFIDYSYEGAQRTEEDHVALDQYAQLSSPSNLSDLEIGPRVAANMSGLGVKRSSSGASFYTAITHPSSPHTPIRVSKRSRHDSLGSPAIIEKKSTVDPAKQLFWDAFNKLLQGPQYADGTPAETLPLIRRVEDAVQILGQTQALDVEISSSEQAEFVDSFMEKLRVLAFTQAGMAGNAIGNPVQMEMLEVMQKVLVALSSIMVSTMQLNSAEQQRNVTALRGLVTGIATLVKVDSHARKALAKTTFV